MFHIHRMVSRAVVLALLGFLYTPSTANAELQQGNPANSSPPIYKQKHLQEIGQVAQVTATNRRVASRVRLLTRFNASCQRGNKSACNRFAKYSKRFPVAAQKVRRTQVRKNRRVASKVRMLTRINASCQRGNRSACNRYAKYSKRYPVAASKVRRTQVRKARSNARRVASKVRLLTRFNLVVSEVTGQPVTDTLSILKGIRLLLQKSDVRKLEKIGA